MTQDPKKIPLWRHIQRDNFTCIHKLADFLELSPTLREKLLETPKFILNLPRRLAEKMAKNRFDDPIFRQFVPLLLETEEQTGFVKDPVCDQSFQQGRTILHKYHGRALWLTSSACAMHCRFCFRQNFPYDTAHKDWSPEMDYLKKNQDIQEIILSGGDPLSLGNEPLRELLLAFDQIPHIRRIRFHTRFPIGIPERIDKEFLESLSQLKNKIFFIIHCNHPLELDPEVVEALQKLKRLGVSVLSQSVLLRGVNDDESTLLALCEALVNAGVMPYYLHLLDPVTGSGHFSVSEERGIALIQYVKKHLSGYGVPRLVREDAGLPSKTFII